MTDRETLKSKITETETWRLTRMLRRAPIARRVLNLLAKECSDGDELMDVCFLLVATAVHLDVGIESPPTTKLSVIAEHFVTPCWRASENAEFRASRSLRVTGRFITA